MNFHEAFCASTIPPPPPPHENGNWRLLTRGVSHCGLAFYIKKYVKGKRRIMETQKFHHAKI
jgi:hypothetical protein